MLPPFQQEKTCFSCVIILKKRRHGEQAATERCSPHSRAGQLVTFLTLSISEHASWSARSRRMYARVTTVQVQPAKMEEAIQITNESIIPAIRQQEGLISFTDLIDRSTGKATLVTLFETEADMKAGMSSGFVEQQVAKIAPLLTETPLIEFYEVLAHE